MTEINGEELESGFLIFDNPKEKGIELQVPIGSPGSNCYARFFMTDQEAENLIRIIQNKLNGRD